MKGQSSKGDQNGGMPLTPIQHWYLENNPDPTIYSVQSIALKVDCPVDADLIVKIQNELNFLVDRHDALRQQFRFDNNRWYVETAERKQAVAIQQVDLSGLSSHHGEEQRAAEFLRLCQQINLKHQTGLHAILFHDERGAELVLAAHHLAVDAISWQILVDELNQIHGQELKQLGQQLPAASSFRDWSLELSRLAETPWLEQQHSYWHNQCHTGHSPHPPATVKSTQCLSAELDTRLTTRLIQDLYRKARLQIDELLIAALSQTLAQGSANSPRLFIERHGRVALNGIPEPIHAVGWFTTLAPIRLGISGTDDPDRVIELAKSALRDVPDKGIGYGMLCYLGPEQLVRKPLSDTDQDQVLFNYLGNTGPSPGVQSTFTRVGPLNLSRSNDYRRIFRWDINASVMDQRLQIRWEFDSTRDSESEVQTMLDRFQDRIKTLAEFVLESGSQTISASDFPMANLDSDKLKKLSSLMGNRPKPPGGGRL